MLYIRPEDWRPRGVERLELNAWLALRQLGSMYVAAGPGSGKTEFLAQRAAYLLETNLCPAPFRILAISFKSDAAENLAARVRKRCPPELADRFTSLTFDAFTKSLVDRFHMAIPLDWRPTKPYKVVFPNFRQFSSFLQGVRYQAPNDWQQAIAALDPKNFESCHVGAYRLPIRRRLAQFSNEFAILQWWANQLSAQPQSNLTFINLNRLAELLLRTTPQIRIALQSTYPFVFIDEFQDTSYAQYDFLLSAFHRSTVCITAVGDDKQRIMTWAGARVDAFERFEQDFAATKISLLLNYRSSPDLVRIQHVVARALDPNAVETVAQTARQVDGDVAQVWVSVSRAIEARHLAQWLANDMALRQRLPRDYAVLVKQRSDDFEADLALAFANQGLRLRNESHNIGRTTLQDLLSDRFAKTAIAILRLGSTPRLADAWLLCSRSLLEIRSVLLDDYISQTYVEEELTSFVRALRMYMNNHPPSEMNANILAQRVTTFLNLAEISRAYVEYSTGDLLAIMAEAFEIYLTASTTGAVSWVEVLDQFEGTGKIPLMTVHKSKGLEYDTVVFVGLDDNAWWSHRPGDPEGLATFFVALSRAKQRAIFSFCTERGQRANVAELYQLLANAGVRETIIN